MEGTGSTDPERFTLATYTMHTRATAELKAEMISGKGLCPTKSCAPFPTMWLAQVSHMYAEVWQWVMIADSSLCRSWSGI